MFILGSERRVVFTITNIKNDNHTPTSKPTEVWDRLPRRDYHDFALPHDVLPMFSFPKGIRVMRVRFAVRHYYLFLHPWFIVSRGIRLP